MSSLDHISFLLFDEAVVGREVRNNLTRLGVKRFSYTDVYMHHSASFVGWKDKDNTTVIYDMIIDNKRTLCWCVSGVPIFTEVDFSFNFYKDYWFLPSSKNYGLIRNNDGGWDRIHVPSIGIPYFIKMNSIAKSMRGHRRMRSSDKKIKLDAVIEKWPNIKAFLLKNTIEPWSASFTYDLTSTRERWLELSFENNSDMLLTYGADVADAFS